MENTLKKTGQKLLAGLASLTFVLSAIVLAPAAASAASNQVCVQVSGAQGSQTFASSEDAFEYIASQNSPQSIEPVACSNLSNQTPQQ